MLHCSRWWRRSSECLCVCLREETTSRRGSSRLQFFLLFFFFKYHILFIVHLLIYLLFIFRVCICRTFVELSPRSLSLSLSLSLSHVSDSNSKSPIHRRVGCCRNLAFRSVPFQLAPKCVSNYSSEPSAYQNKYFPSVFL